MARLGNDRNVALTPPWRVGPFRRASRLRRSLAGAQGFCNCALELDVVESGQQLAQFVKTSAQQTQATNDVTTTNRKQCLKHTG